MFKKIFITFSLLAILLMGCQNSKIQDTRIPPYTFRTSKPGSVTLHGELIVKDPDNAMPAPDNGIYLVLLPTDQMVITVPPISFGESPQADVYERTGEFVFTDIQKGKYIVIVLTVYNGQIPARTEDGKLAVIDVKESDRDQTIELKYLMVP
jgi:hypothetical protein